MNDILTICFLLVALTCRRCLAIDHGIDIPTTKPLNIAHRGSSGVLPEGTCEAYALAVEQGADFMECDVGLTADLQLICVHESWLDMKTDVAQKFPDRRRTRWVPEKNANITDYFSVDFLLSELRDQVRVRQAIEERDQRFNYQFGICPFAEYLNIASGADRVVGIYAEVKDPLFYQNYIDEVDVSQTKTFEQLIASELEAAGWHDPRQPAFVQSFNYNSIVKFGSLSSLNRVYLSSKDISNATLDQCVEDGLYGLGVKKVLMIPVGTNGSLSTPTDLVQRIQERGLRAHVWTFRNDKLNVDLAFDAHAEFQIFQKHGIEGYFTDFPQTLNSFHNKCSA